VQRRNEKRICCGSTIKEDVFIGRKICILGDSVAKGVLLDDVRNRYCIAKANLGTQLAQALGCSVTNLAKFGSTVTDGLARFEKQKDSLNECRMVLMNFGGNDSDFLWQEISTAPDRVHEPKTTVDVFEKTYLKLIDCIRNFGITPVLLNLVPVDHARYFSWISRERNPDNILKWLGGTTEFIYRWHEQYNIAVHRIAQTAGVKLIDIRSAFLARRDSFDYLSPDGIHPNHVGHSLIASTVLQQLKGLDQSNASVRWPLAATSRT